MDPVTAEKVAARRRHGHGRVHHLHTAFRCVEAVAAVCLLSWSSARLPSLARLSADLLRRLVASLLAPRFVFLLGNAIVLTLLAMSCRRPAPSSGGGDIYDQFLACQRRAIQSRPPPPPPDKVEEPPARGEKAAEPPVRREKAGRAYRRTRSEREKRRRVEPDLLRRSISEVSREEAAAEAEKAAAEQSKEEDAEEFRQMVESFIAGQLKRFHWESMDVVGVVPAASSSSAAAPGEPPQVSTTVACI